MKNTALLQWRDVVGLIMAGYAGTLVCHKQMIINLVQQISLQIFCFVQIPQRIYLSP